MSIGGPTGPIRPEGDHEKLFGSDSKIYRRSQFGPDSKIDRRPQFGPDSKIDRKKLFREPDIVERYVEEYQGKFSSYGQQLRFERELLVVCQELCKIAESG